MPDQAVETFTYDEYIKIKRTVLDRDVQGTLDFIKAKTPAAATDFRTAVRPPGFVAFEPDRNRER
jgi:hypothetical protein